jgi:glycerophosphoryl diester phosphodiesterase
MQFPLIIAHRGDSSNALENSLEAFRLALAVPVDMIELDVRMSRDEVLYVMHDKQTGRTCDRDIDIEAASASEIAGLKLRNGEPLPLLGDVLKLAAGKAGVNIEIKSDRAGAVLSRHIFQHGFPGPIVVSSFKEGELQAVRDVMGDLPAAVIYDAFSLPYVEDYRRRGYTSISLRKNTVTEPLIKACHKQGIRVFVWTVDEEEEMKKFIGWNIDAIYTNKPRVLRELAARRPASGL